MKAFTPCPSRWLDREGGDIVYGCLRPVEDGHMHQDGPAHSNGGRSWSDVAEFATQRNRCESLTQGSNGGMSRCVEDAGHYPASIHARTGFRPKAWTDEMSLNPPYSFTRSDVPDLCRSDRIVDEAEKVAAIWADLSGAQRRTLNEHVNHDLYKALHCLAGEAEGRVPLPGSDDDVLTLILRWGGEMYRLAAYEKEGRKGEALEVSDLAGALMGQIEAALTSTTVVPDGTNGTPGVTGFFPPAVEIEDEGYPAAKRVADLERILDAQRVRTEALHHARKAWGGTMSEDVDRHADNIVRIAQAFEKYLTDGTGGAPAVEPAVPTEPTYRQARNDVIDAATAWADQAHFHNPSGWENWRNWSDTPDQDLINAVAVLTGRPEINNKEKP